MSDAGSPSLLNLREFRMQRKPTLSHNTSVSSEDSPLAKVKVERRRIMQFVDSDSDEDAQNTRKSSESSNSRSSSKSPSKPSSELSPEDKKKRVQEREQMVRYLMKKYHGIQSFLVYEALSRAKFELTQADAFLGEKNTKDEGLPDFETWRKDENVFTSPQTKTPTDRSSHIQRTIMQQKDNVARRISESFGSGNGSNHSNSHHSHHSNSHHSNSHHSNSHRSSSESNHSGSSNHLKRKDRSNGSSKSSKRSRIEKCSDDSDEDNRHYKERMVYDSDEDSDMEISDELTPEKRRVLDFLQTGTPNELLLMASCSKKKVDALLACRPFNGWIDLVQKLQSNKNLNTDLLNAAQRVISTRNNIQQLMRKCSNLSQQLQYAVNKGAEVKHQPAILNAEMKLTKYQMVGLNWLVVLNKQGVNGILADEMGLGKTVQVIAFLAWLKETGSAKNTHLIVVPSSTLENWQNEFDRWCPEIKVLLYYGSVDERRSFRMLISKGNHREYDVILTTYTMVASGPEERKMFRVIPMHYVIFDEAHMLKNMNTQRYESLVRIKASSRILLTGTPLQNNLLELMSLLIFVMPNIFSEKTEDLKSLFQKNATVKKDNDDLPTFEKEQIDQAKRIMQPFVLRRLKRDVLQDLPTKTDKMLQIPLAPTQEEQYVNLVASFKAAGDNPDTAVNGMSMMTDLRKLSNHPLLLRYYYKDKDLPAMAKRLAADPIYKDTVQQYIIDDLTYMSDFEIHTMTKQYPCLKKFALPEKYILISGKFQFLDKKLEELKSGGHRVLIFSQYVIMLNIVEEYLRIRNHSFLRLDGSTPVNTRQQLIDEYTEDESIFIFLLSTRAGGLGINLTAADTVIIHDIDFNPYNDKQAEDRCHRMGQRRPVSVYRLISKGTIEEGMWQMTQEKLKLEKEITADESDASEDLKSVVTLLSTALGIGADKVTNLVSPTKKAT